MPKQKNESELGGLPDDLMITQRNPLGHYLELYVDAPAPKDPACPHCGCRGCSKHGSDGSYSLRHLQSGGKSVVIIVKRLRYYCSQCERTFAYRYNWMHRSMSITSALYEQILAELHGTSSIRQIARSCLVTEDIVRDVLDSIDIPFGGLLPETLCIDEFKGDSGDWNPKYRRHSRIKFHCVIVDGDNRCVIDILRSRREEDLRRYFEKYPLKERLRVKYLCCDMHDGFANLAGDIFPNAIVCIDPFHVVKRLNEAIGDTRNRFYKPLLRQQEREPKNNAVKMEIDVLKGTSRLIKTWDSNLPDYWNKEEPKARKRLQAIFSRYPDIQEVYEAVQDYHNTVMLASAPLRKLKLSEWISRYESSYVGELRDAVSTIQKYKVMIINSLMNEKSNGPVEGINNFIKVLKRNAYGFKNFEIFRKRILLACDNTGIGDSQIQPSLVSERRSVSEANNKSQTPKATGDPDKAGRVQRLYREGKTMREIAAMESCSVSHVFKLVHEQDSHTAVGKEPKSQKGSDRHA
ncbi:MAG: ISL3 family transposase [Lachnospiraceae bacterium]|nr:ISL3 family transposase [Lachnospiraceae bacterium]